MSECGEGWRGAMFGGNFFGGCCGGVCKDHGHLLIQCERVRMLFYFFVATQLAR